MGGSPVVKTVKRAVKSVVKPVVETIKPTSSAPNRRKEVIKKMTKVKQSKPESTTVSRTKLVRSTRKKEFRNNRWYNGISFG